MYPWLWVWSPQFNWTGDMPLGGEVAQDFFNSIPRDAGNGNVEEKAFLVASYGRQLGLITEVLLEVTREMEAANKKKMEGKPGESLERLKKIQERIELLKPI